MLSVLYLDLVIEAPLKLPVYHVHCVAIPINTCILYSERRSCFWKCVKHFAAKLLNGMQRVSPIRYNNNKCATPDGFYYFIWAV